MLPIYHYTCGHHAPTIERSGILVPGVTLARTTHQRSFMRKHPIASMTSQVVWCTTIPDLTYFNRQAAGLTSDMLDCDRSEHRFLVTAGTLSAWIAVRNEWPQMVVEYLEQVEGARPETWWIGRGPLTCTSSPHRTIRESRIEDAS